MKILIVPVSYKSEFKGSASERYRCNWLAPYLPADVYDGTQELGIYDAVIWQKAFHPDLVEKCKDKIQVFDDTDSIWRHPRTDSIVALLDMMDFVTVSTEELAQQYRKVVTVPVHTVPDGHKLSAYKYKKKHTNKPPKVVWFGYADNFPAGFLETSGDWLIISERPVGAGQWIEYNSETFYKDLLRADIAFCPPAPLKSNNKNVTAWALGLAVATTLEDITRLQDVAERTRQVRSIDLDQFHVRHSANQLRRLLARRGEYYRVLVSIPNTGWVHKHSVFALTKLLPDSRYKVRAILPTHVPFENNLHHIVQEWLDQSREDFWLTFDSDNPPMRNPLDLVELDKDTIGCPTPVWHCSEEKPGERPFYWNAYDYVPEKDAYKEHQPQSGLQRVDAIGTGCVLFARRVFEHSEMRKGPFLRTTYPDGRVEKGNDIAFCERARAQGFEIWAHYDYPCRHFNEIELTEAIQAFGAIGKAKNGGDNA